MWIFVVTFKSIPAVNLCNTLGDKADLVLHFTCHIVLQFLEQLSQSRVCCKEQKTRESGAAESKAVDIYQSLCWVADMRWSSYTCIHSLLNVSIRYIRTAFYRVLEVWVLCYRSSVQQPFFPLCFLLAFVPSSILPHSAPCTHDAFPSEKHAS